MTQPLYLYAPPNRGSAMGPNHACDYVAVFVSELDWKLMSTCPVPLLLSLLPRLLQGQYRYLDWSRGQYRYPDWSGRQYRYPDWSRGQYRYLDCSRFRDDGFAILLNSEHLQTFTDYLQSLHLPNVKWTVSHGKTATHLDVSLSLKDGKIITDVFSKHNHSYLPPSSCHSPAVFKVSVQGTGSRRCMVCSEDDDLDRRLEEYKRHLTISGWKYKTSKERLAEGAKKDTRKH